MQRIVLKRGRVFDPASGLDGVFDLLVSGERIASIAPHIVADDAEVIDCSGQLRIGGVADISVLSDERGRWILSDNEGTRVQADRSLRPLFCLRGGRRFDATAPILFTLHAA